MPTAWPAASPPPCFSISARTRTWRACSTVWRRRSSLLCCCRSRRTPGDGRRSRLRQRKERRRGCQNNDEQAGRGKREHGHLLGARGPIRRRSRPALAQRPRRRHRAAWLMAVTGRAPPKRHPPPCLLQDDGAARCCGGGARRGGRAPPHAPATTARLGLRPRGGAPNGHPRRSAHQQVPHAESRLRVVAVAASSKAVTTETVPSAPSHAALRCRPAPCRTSNPPRRAHCRTGPRSRPDRRHTGAYGCRRQRRVSWPARAATRHRGP